MIPFPDHDIDPLLKDKGWILKYCKAAWSYFAASGFKSMYSARDNYREFADYAQATQSVNKYKKIIKADDTADSTYKNINYQPLPVLPKFLEIARAIVDKNSYGVEASLIDPDSKAKARDYFKKLETKIKLHTELAKISPELADNSPVAPQAGDPVTLTELDVLKHFTFKENLAMAMERLVSQVFLLNNFNEVRAEIKEDLIRYGVGACKSYVAENGEIILRRVNPANLVTSRSVKRNFADIDFAGEVVEMPLSKFLDLYSSQLTEGEIKIIKDKVGKQSIGLRQGMTSMANGYYDGTVKCLDIEFLSYDKIGFEKSIDKFNNPRITRASKEKATDVKRVAMVYRGLWVLETESVVAYGKVNNQARKRMKLEDTSLSYSIFAPNWNYYSMQAISKVQLAMPIVDIIQLAWLRLQVVIAKAKPLGYAIEVGSLEDVPLGAGGTQLTPVENIKLFNSSGTLYFRRRDMEGNLSNYQPITEIPGGMGGQALEYYTIIQQNMDLLRSVLGLNEATDSFAGQRAYGAAVNAGIESTNNSLYGIVEADREILEQVSNRVVLYFQSLARTRKINGIYTHALGEETINTLADMEDISAVEFGINLTPRASDQERAQFFADIQKFVDQGQVDLTDVIMLRNMENINSAYAVLASKIKDKQEREQQQEQMNIQMNAQMQAQAAQAAEQAKLNSQLQILAVKQQIQDSKNRADLEIEKLKLQAAYINQLEQKDATLSKTQIEAESKEYIAELLNETRKQASEAGEERNAAQKTTDMLK